MTWRYEQSTGKLWHLEGVGYSGFEEAKNQPDLEDVKGVRNALSIATHSTTVRLTVGWAD